MNSDKQSVENLLKDLQNETNALHENVMRENACKSDPRSASASQPSGPKAFQSEAESVAKTDTREELITLAESGKIKYTVNYIKKASSSALDKIKVEYERKHLDETNDYVANNILSSVSKLLKYFNLVKNPDELEHDLKKNYLLKRDVKNIVGMVTPSIPYVGLLCGGATVGKHVMLNTLNESERSEPSQSQSETTE